jgi:hypothetical protein
LVGSIICTLSGSKDSGDLRAIGGCGAAATTVMTVAILTSAVSTDLVPKIVGMWAALSSSATYLALTGSLFQEFMLLQKAFDYSPLLAGSLDVGPAVIFVVCAALTPRISARFGAARTVAVGLSPEARCPASSHCPHSCSQCSGSPYSAGSLRVPPA